MADLENLGHDVYMVPALLFSNTDQGCGGTCARLYANLIRASANDGNMAEYANVMNPFLKAVLTMQPMKVGEEHSIETREAFLKNMLDAYNTANDPETHRKIRAVLKKLGDNELALDVLHFVTMVQYLFNHIAPQLTRAYVNTPRPFTVFQPLAD